MRRICYAAGGLMLVVAATTVARGQDSPPPPTPAGDSISRQEYDRLKRDQETLREEVETLKRALAEERAARTPATPAAAPPAAPAAPAPAAAAPGAAPATPGAAPATGAAAPTSAAPAAEPATAEDIDELQKEIKNLKDQLDLARPGTSIFTIHGDMAVGYTNVRGAPSTFDAGIAPLLLIRPTDRILIEAAADIGVETDSDNNSSTSFDLTIANISYLVNDHLAVGAGLFVVPFGVYHNHFDPPWINKFPDDPLPFGDGGIAPGSEVGVFARGAVPVRSMKFTYDVYLTNGPNLSTTNPDTAGSLNFDDFTDLNNGKAVGGRIGFLPLPNIEMGYSVEYAETAPAGFEKVNALLQALDLNWRQDVPQFRGLLDVRTEWVWSDVGRATYDPSGALGFGPISFSNYRQGGYVQACFRPTHADQKLLRNLELVSRYDWLIQPLGAPGGEHEKRLAVGVDYWVTPAVVLKAAYEWDDKKLGPDQDGVLLQVGVGF